MTAIIITSIICVTVVLVTAINAIGQAKIRKESRTIFDDIFKFKEDK